MMSLHSVSSPENIYQNQILYKQASSQSYLFTLSLCLAFSSRSCGVKMIELFFVEGGSKKRKKGGGSFQTVSALYRVTIFFYLMSGLTTGQYLR